MKKSKLTTYLEDIALLQRGTGECLITLATRPDISKEILANNGVVLTFKNHMEKDIMCELLNIDVENRNYLSILEEGQCIIRINSIKESFLLSIPLIKHNSLSFSEIRKNNIKFLNKNKSLPNKSESIIESVDGSEETPSQKSSSLIHNDEAKDISPQSISNLNSFSELETYVNQLYKLHKKKE